MLKKLIKHEWKDTKAVGITCNTIVLALTVIGVLFFSLDTWYESQIRGEAMEEFTAITMMLYFVMFAWGIVAACAVVKYFFFYRYYKNLFTDHGYLMNTLPVKSTELLNAKLIISMAWQYITMIVVGISIFALFVSIVGGFGNISLKDIFRVMGEIDIDWDAVLSWLPTIVSLIIYMLTYPIGSMLLMYTAVCLGQTSKKHKFLISVLILVGFGILMQAVLSYATLPFSLMTETINRTVINVVAVVLLIIYIGAVIGLYFINKYFLENKLNLE